MKNASWIKYFVIIDIFIFLGVVYFFFIKENPQKDTNNLNTEISQVAEDPDISEVDDNTIISGKFDDIDYEFTLEVANTDKKRADGLMFVEELQKNKGMLFIFENEQNLTFWMKNTYISLDILFLDENFKIVSIQKNAKPNQTQELYPSNAKAKYVIEINGGMVQELGIEEEQRFVVSDISN
jgi:uncharacterized membrane protein (UPF0127 family)